MVIPKFQGSPFLGSGVENLQMFFTTYWKPSWSANNDDDDDGLKFKDAATHKGHLLLSRMKTKQSTSIKCYNWILYLQCKFKIQFQR